MGQTLRKLFDRFASKATQVAGSSPAFTAALAGLVAWALTGPTFHFNDTWQLIVNTSTTIVTFLTVFLIQHSQNKNDKVTQAKLDAIIKALDAVDNKLVRLEDEDEEEVDRIRDEI